MKLILTERQHKLLNEQTDGLDHFMEFLIDTHPNVEQFKTIVRKFIEDSGCQNIEIKPIKYGAAGLALHDKVVINPIVFNRDLNYTMYVIFHEIAHQYQYKKYGRDKMYSLYVGELPMDEAVKFLRNTENVADQFAIRKCRQLHKLGLLDRVGLVQTGLYDMAPDMMLVHMLQTFRKMLREKGVTTPDRVSEIMYNSIVNGMTNPQQVNESKQEKVKCDECGWEWKLSEGGDDPYTCHKCGHVNKKEEVDERSRSFAFTRKKRLYSKPERMSNPLRYKKIDRLDEDKPLTDDQIKSIEQLNKDAKFLTCKNCKKKFTQVTHKKKKSLPICPWCGTHNNEKK